jgi:hypothetical protein
MATQEPEPPTASTRGGRICAAGASAAGVWPVQAPAASFDRVPQPGDLSTAAGAALLCIAAIYLVLLVVHRLARPHTEMHVEIIARDARQALVYDQTPVSPPPGDGSTGTGAGTPDSAPVPVPQRVHVEIGGRHRKAA